MLLLLMIEARYVASILNFFSMCVAMIPVTNLTQPILLQMRKVSELAPSTDKPKANERNLLLEQIRSKVGEQKCFVH